MNGLVYIDIEVFLSLCSWRSINLVFYFRTRNHKTLPYLLNSRSTAFEIFRISFHMKHHALDPRWVKTSIKIKVRFVPQIIAVASAQRTA